VRLNRDNIDTKDEMQCIQKLALILLIEAIRSDCSKSACTSCM